MKVRTGFVSNSSSSSFVCEICSRSQEKYDLTQKEAEMYICENGHQFCRDHVDLSKIPVMRKFGLLDDEISDADLNQLKDDEIDKLDETFGEEYCSDFPKDLCPICNLEIIPEKLLLKYLLKELCQTPKNVASQIRKQMTNIEELKDYLGR